MEIRGGWNRTNVLTYSHLADCRNRTYPLSPRTTADLSIAHEKEKGHGLQPMPFLTSLPRRAYPLV